MEERGPVWNWYTPKYTGTQELRVFMAWWRDEAAGVARGQGELPGASLQFVQALKSSYCSTTDTPCQHPLLSRFQSLEACMRSMTGRTGGLAT